MFDGEGLEGQMLNCLLHVLQQRSQPDLKTNDETATLVHALLFYNKG